jgi:hypothetical protein
MELPSFNGHAARSCDTQYELLKLEITLIDSAIRSHDSITKDVKNWAVITWTASIGLAVSTQNLRSATWVTAFVPAAFWLVDSAYRRVQRSFITRMQDIAAYVNGSEFFAAMQTGTALTFPILKMRAKDGPRTSWARVMLFRTVGAIYALMMMGSVLAWLLVDGR